MENIMMLPASYCVMNEEEMTYTTGGASAIQAIAAWVFPPYAWLAGVTAIRDYRKKNPILGLRMVWTISQMIWGRVCLISSMTLRVPVGFWVPPLPELAL